MDKTLERFSSLAKVAVKRLRTYEQGSHNFATYPSYIDEGVPHRVTSISVEKKGLDIFLRENDPCGIDSVYFPLDEHIKRTEELLKDSECREDALMTLRSEVRILLTFLKEWFEGRLDALNEESARQRSQCDPYWEVFANGVEVDFEKRTVSFEYTVMNDKFWDDVPFDTLKAENGLDMDEYTRICKELRESEELSVEEVIDALEEKEPSEGSFTLGGRAITRIDPADTRLIPLTHWLLHRDGNTHPSGRDILCHRKTEQGRNILYVKFRRPDTDAFDKNQIIYRIELLS